MKGMGNNKRQEGQKTKKKKLGIAYNIVRIPTMLMASLSMVSSVVLKDGIGTISSLGVMLFVTLMGANLHRLFQITN
jgi:hypothetical protein